MIRIVDGIVMESTATDSYDVRAVQLGNGHTEVTACRVVTWHEVDWSPTAKQAYFEAVERCRLESLEAEAIAERKAKDRERAGRRARTRVRRLCKAMGVDTLLTLTYRACEGDIDQVKADLKEFNRRMLAFLPTFRFVGCFELQKRGAWHMHLATSGLPSSFERTNEKGQKYRVKSFDLFRHVWRSVTGERGGNVDLSRRKSNSRRSPAKIAAYISKYIGKAFSETGMSEGKNRWTAYGPCEVLRPVLLGRVSSLREALEVVYSVLPGVSVVVTQALDHFRDWFFVASELPVV